MSSESCCHDHAFYVHFWHQHCALDETLNKGFIWLIDYELSHHITIPVTLYWFRFIFERTKCLDNLKAYIQRVIVLKNWFVSFFVLNQNVLLSGVLADCVKEHCGSFYTFLKVSWLLLFVVIVSRKMSALHLHFWRNHKKKLLHQPPVAQQQKQQQQHAHSPPKGAGKWRKNLLLLFVLLGFTMSIWLFWYMNEDINLRREETLANMCDERARMLQDQFNVSMNHVHALAILVSTFHHEKHTSAIDQVNFPSTLNFSFYIESSVLIAFRSSVSMNDHLQCSIGLCMVVWYFIYMLTF